MKTILFILPVVLLMTAVAQAAPDDHRDGAASARATVTWTGGGTNDNWGNPANWDVGVPTAADDVVIDLNGTYTVILNVNATVNSLTLGGATGTQTLNINNNNLRLNAASTINANGVLVWAGSGVSNGDITGPGTLTNNGLIVTSGGLKRLFKTLINNATVRHTSGTLEANTNGVFRNEAGATLEIQGNPVLQGFNGGQFINEGTIARSSGTGTAIIRRGPVLVNRGTIDVQTGVLRMENTTRHENATLTASAGARLVLGGGTHTLAGTISGSPTGAVQFRNNASNLRIDAAGATLDFGGTGFEWAGGNLGDPSDIVGPGTLTNDGLITTSTSGGTFTRLFTTFMNNGTLIHTAGVLEANTNGVFRIETGGLLDIQGNAPTLQRFGTGTFVNEGTLRRSSGAGQARFQQNGGTGTALTNRGQIDIQTGSMRLVGPTRHENAVWTASAGATLSVGGTATIQGTLTGSPAGRVVFAGSVTNLRIDAAGATLDFGGTGFEWGGGNLGDPSDIIGPGTLTNDGLITTTTASGTFNRLFTTLSNNGTLIHTAGVLESHNGGVFRIETGGLLDIQGNAPILQRFGTGTFINEGTLRRSSGAGQARFQQNGGTGTALTNRGQIDIQTGSMRLVGPTRHENAVWTASAGATLSVGGTATIQGTLTGSPAGRVVFTGNATNLRIDAAGATLDFGGTGFEWGGGNLPDPSDIDGTGTLINQGLLFTTGSNFKRLFTTLENEATFTHTAGTLEANTNGVFDNKAGGTMDIEASAVVQRFGNGRLTNAGTFIKDDAGTNPINLPFTNQNGGVIEAASGTFDFNGTLNHDTGALIKGDATVDVTGATFNNNGTIAPGASPGILTYTGNYNPTATATLDVELGGPLPGLLHDQLQVSGDANLDGILDITFTGGFAPGLGDTFTILTCGGTCAGTFTTVNAPAGYTFSVQANAGDVIAEVTALPNTPPTTTGIANVNVLEDATDEVINLFNAFDDAEDPDVDLTFTVQANDNPGLFIATTIDGLAGTLTLDFADEANGTANLTVRATDTGGLFVEAPFTVDVTVVNDAPGFTAGANQSASDTDGPQTIAGWATGINAGPADEAGQTLTFTVTNDNNAIFATQPDVDELTGDLTFTPAVGQSGIANVTVTLMDDGGTANGGVDQSAPQAFTITVTLSAFDCATQVEIPPSECDALVALYTATDGANWTNNANWLTNPIAIWFGVTIAGGTVTDINLEPNNLTGTLPPEIGDFPNLQNLRLGSNNLTGAIPPQIGNLTSIQSLELELNGLTGAIPPQIGNLPAVTFIDFDGNILNGAIPTQIGNLTTLQVLQAESNQFTGPLPASIGNLTNLQTLDLSNNPNLNGNLPPEIGNLSSLTFLDLDGDGFTGVIPPEIGNLTAVQVLDLSGNNFTGTIPTEIGTLTNVTFLDVSLNSLTGAIPTQIGNLTNLTTFNAEFNTLNGTIPTTIATLTNLQVFNVQGNNLEGAVPTQFATLANLQTLLFNRNQFVDFPDLSPVPGLNLLFIQDNLLTFEDIEPNLGVAPTFTYAPQGMVGTAQTFNIDEGDNLTLQIPVGGANNVYQWFKDGLMIPGATADNFTITNATAADAGDYTLQITNTVATALTLVSHPLTVNIVNTRPTTTGIANVNVLEDAADAILDLFAAFDDAEDPDTDLTFTVESNDNPGLFAATTIDGLAGTLTLDFADEANGTANLTVRATDTGGLFVEASFQVTVTAVNDAPSFTAGSDQSVGDLDGPQTVPGWATNISPGPADEASQTLSFTVTNDNNALFATQPAVDATTGTLTFAPAVGQGGTATVTVTLADDGGTANGGLDQSPPQVFTITVNIVNTPPTTTGLANLNVLEDAPDATIDLFAAFDDAQDADADLTFTVENNDNPGLFAATTIDGAAGTLTLDFADEANGTANLTVRATDTGSLFVETSFAVDVTAVNDAPSFTAGSDQSVGDLDGPQTVPGWATNISPGPADEASQTLSFTVTNDNNALFATQPAVDATTGTLTFAPAVGQGGTATVTVTLADDGGTANGGVDQSPPQVFTITVTLVNTPPTTTGIADVTVLEDAADTVIDLFAAFDDAQDADADLSFTLESNDNPGLFAATTIDGAAGTLTLDFADDANGTATLTVRATDTGGLFVETSFTVDVTAVNDAPSFTEGPSLKIIDLAGPQTVPGWATAISAGPPDEAAQTLSFTVVNDNNALFSVQPDIDETTGDLTFAPAVGQSGTATVTVTLTDDGGTANGGVDQSPPQAFTITINPEETPPVNTPPTTTGIADVTVLEDAPDATIDLFAAFDDAQDADTDLSFTVESNDNPGLFAATTIDGAAGTLMLDFADDANGTATLTVRATDTGGLFVETSFQVTVTAVNDAPSFTAGPDQSVGDLDGPQTVPGWATAISAGPPDEAAQTLSFTVVNDNNALFASQPDVGEVTGDLTFAPAVGQSGTATVTVTLMDDSGTVNGGVDQSPPQAFTITVNIVNTPPTTTGIADVTGLEDAPDATIDLFAAFDDAQDADTDLSFTVESNDNPGLFAATTIDGAAGTLTLDFADDANGTATLTVRATDTGGLFVETSFQVTVTAVNDAPSFTAGPDQSVGDLDGPQTIAGWATNISAGPPDEVAQTLSFTVVNDNNALFTTLPDVDEVTGDLTFAPAVGQGGTATVTVTLTDDGGTANGGVDQSPPQAFIITAIPASNRPPVAAVDAFNVGEGETLSIDAPGILTNDADPDDDPLTVILINGPSHAAAFTLNIDGSFTYTPAPGFTGTDTFSYRAHDGAVPSAPATVTITVNDVNNPPVANNDAFQVDQNSVLSIDAPGVLANDTDADSDLLTATLVNGPAHGTLSLNANGSFTYTPAIHFNGDDHFTYRISDGPLQSETATVSITVRLIPPLAPILISPDHGATDQPLDIEVVWERSLNSTAYLVQYATTPDFSNAITVNVGSETTARLTNLAPHTLYFWRVQALNGAGASPYSEVFSFTTVPPPPPSPTLIAPASGSYFSALRTTLIWNAPAGTSEYDLQIATDALFQNLMVDQQGMTAPSFELAGLVLNQRYHWRVRARNAGGESDWSQPFSFFIYPAQIPLAVQRDFGEATRSEQFRMVGLPGAVNLPIGPMFSGPLNREWVVYAADYVSPESFVVRYDESDRFRFRPGEGFWMLSRHPWILPDTTVETVPLETGNVFTIPLHGGWNIIANPFLQEVSWALVQQINGVTRAIYRYQGRYTEADRMAPYEAYYFFNADNRPTLQIPYPPAHLEALPTAPPSKHLAPVEGLHLRIRRDDQEMTGVEIALHPEATDVMDPFDRLAPPADFHPVHLALKDEGIHAEYGWMARTVWPSLPADGIVFDLELKTQGDDSLVLTIEGTTHFNAYEVYLVDPSTARFFDLHTTAQVPLRPPEEVSRYQVVIGSAAFIETLRQQVVPHQTRLAGNYPNPFNEQTRISYALSEPAHVTLDVFNLLGQRVRRLVGAEQEPGAHDVHWDGRNEGGQPVSSGVYLYRLQAGGVKLSRTMIRIH